MMTRSKRFVEAEDKESVVHKKKGTDGMKNDVRGERNQEKEKQIMVKKKEFNDQEGTQGVAKAYFDKLFTSSNKDYGLVLECVNPRLSEDSNHLCSKTSYKK